MELCGKHQRAEPELGKTSVLRFRKSFRMDVKV